MTNPAAVGQIYNVGEVEALSMFDWVVAIASVTGWTGKVIPVPSDGLPESMRETMDVGHDLVTDSSRIRADLGYEEGVDRSEALRRTIEWEREHPPQGNPPPDYDSEDRILQRLADDSDRSNE